MSNPAVINLDTEFSGSLEGFRVEDNIGEAIHIHFDNVRLDFTINEFLSFAETVRDSIIELKCFDENLLKLPYDFLKRFHKELIDYIKIEDETIEANNLYIIEEYRFLGRITLKRKIKLLNSNLYKNNVESIKFDCSYLPFNNARYIKNKINELDAGNKLPLFLFNNSNVIRDGSLLALAYYFRYGNDFKIPVKRISLRKVYYDNYLMKNIKLIVKSICSRLFCFIN